MRKSHKARLAAISTAVVAALLAAVFLAVVTLARRTTFREERDKMREAFQAVARLELPQFSMASLAEAGPGLSARVYDRQGRLIAFRGPMPALPDAPFVGFVERPGWLILVEHAGEERVALAESTADVEAGLSELTLVLAALWLPLSLLVGGATWLAAQSVFRPLTRLADGAAAIEDFSQRLSTPDEAEFGAFADGLNRMLARIEESAMRGERFAADAAHELRTPLAVLRTQVETTLLRPRTEGEYVVSHEALLVELERLSAVVEALLRSARAPAGDAAPLDLEPLVRAAGVRSVLSNLRMDLAPAQARALPEEVSVVVDNLLDNARRFAPEGTEILLSLAASEEGAKLRVVDHGPGIAPEHAPHVFERFYRADEDRGRASGGAGIGLAVCRRFVATRGGSIGVEETPGGGATFVVRWPPV